MISTIDAYKEMVLASATGKANQQLRKATDNAVSGIAGLLRVELPDKTSNTKETDAFSVNMSVSKDVFTAVDNFFNMGRSGRFDAFHTLSPEDMESFVKIVAELAKSGYMGYEELVVNKKVERHEMTTQIGDDRLRGARVYNRPKTPHK